MTKKEIKKIIRNHHRWLKDNSKGERANFCGVDLRCMNLSDVDLRRANLCDVDLRCMNLCYVNLSSANLNGVNFSNSDLCYVNLSSANLSGVNFSGSDLSESNFRESNLCESNLCGANLSGADLRDTDLSGVNFSNSELSYTDLREANLSGANLNNIKAWNTVGNTREIKTIQTEKYTINIINDKMVQIGCEQHSFDDWMNFDDETIDQMDTGALEWWKTWKPILKILVDKSK